MKNTLLFCLGLSGTGKSYFIQNTLPKDSFYKLISLTTRPIRDNEINGRDYYFCSEADFDKTPLATRLWVNEDFWSPGKPKWLYGVPEFEIYTHLNTNLVYDVIQPKYARQMIDWFVANKLDKKYDFKTLFFVPSENSVKIAHQRANMPDDDAVRRINTCSVSDFLRVGLDIDFLIKNTPTEKILSPRLNRFLRQMARTR